jgi:predicted phosphodiesterase
MWNSGEMKIALISDVHGNRWALEEVLAHAARQEVEAVWNLGDILSGPLDVAGTAERLLALGALTISGNHERQLLACADGPGLPSDEHAFRHTTPEHRAWLRGLPATARPRPDVLLCHGTPHRDVQPLLETHERGRGMRMATRQESLTRIEGAPPARLIACGHTHVPRLMQLGDDCLVVNPAAWGCKRSTMTRRGRPISSTTGRRTRPTRSSRSTWPIREVRRVAAVGQHAGR